MGIEGEAKGINKSSIKILKYMPNVGEDLFIQIQEACRMPNKQEKSMEKILNP